MFPYFFSEQLPVAIQAIWLFFSITLNVVILYSLNKKNGFISICSLFIALNLAFIVPFQFSHSGGTAGFAAALGVAEFGFNSTLFFLYIFQSICIPVFLWLITYSNLFNPNNALNVKFNFPLLTVIFIVFLIVYLVGYYIAVKPGLAYAMIGDFASAKEQRIAAVLGKTSAASGVSRIFDYKNLVFLFLQGVLLALVLYSSNVLKSNAIKYIFLVLLLMVSFSDFSKGALASIILILFCYSSYVKRKTYFKLLPVFGILILVLLTTYTYFTHSTGILLQNSFVAILNRFFNNASSVYLQMGLYEREGPIGFLISDWGFAGRLFDLEPFLPKENVYAYIYNGDGQAGSSIMSELYFSLRWLALPVSLVMILPLVWFDKVLVRLRRFDSFDFFMFSSLLYIIAFKVLVGLFNQPFKIYSLITVVRVEYMIFLLFFFIFFRFRYTRNN